MSTRGNISLSALQGYDALTRWVMPCLAGMALMLAAAVGLATPAAAGGPCGAAIAAAEAHQALPTGLLQAIAEVESGRAEPVSGAVQPWPWTTNAENQGLFFASRAEAVSWVQATQARGVTSIDVGCLQVNLKQHPAAFTSLDDAFDPVRNAEYAALFLRQLRSVSADWNEAVGWYHSHTQELADPYRVRVARSFLEGVGQPPERAFAAAVMARRARLLSDLAQAWSAAGPGNAAPMKPPAATPAATVGWDQAAGARPWGAALPPPVPARRPGSTSKVAAKTPPTATTDRWTAAAELAWEADALSLRGPSHPQPAPRRVASTDRIHPEGP